MVDTQAILKSKLCVLCLCFLGLLFVFIGSSYAYITVVSKQQESNVVEVGTLKLSYDDEDKLLNVNDAFPMSDEDGLKQEPYTFTVTNTGSLGASYKVLLENDYALIQADNCLEKLLSYENLKISIDEGDPLLLSELKSTNYTLATGYLSPNQSKTYTLKLWLKEESGNEILGKHFHGKIIVEGTQENIIDYDGTNANAPVLTDGMIPVIYEDGIIKKANLKETWYNYSKQEWANAVTVIKDQRSFYETASPGTEIPLSDINTMWVWIPRYEYNYVSIENYANGTEKEPGIIEINFLKGTNPSTTKDYILHPAFKFGLDDLEGLWYGKFEPSASATEEVEIKPNALPWSKIKIATCFYHARDMQTTNYETYGFTQSTFYDVHMSKNSEWGAVAYLSQSIYGKRGNDNYQGVDKEVAVNNCETQTGTLECGESYETVQGQTTSTTGNITGVYDMAGGTHEFMMAAFGDELPLVKNAGFDNLKPLPEAKYYDLYKSTHSNIACDEGVCYGQALSETSGWYGDTYEALTSAKPWIGRGGSAGHSTSGIFRVNGEAGEGESNRSFRVVIGVMQH